METTEYSRTAKTGVVAASQASAALAMLVIAALLSRLLSKPEYATYRQTLLAFQVSAPLLALGLPQALLYFLPREPGRERGILAEVLVVLVSVGLAMAVFMWMGGNGVVARLFGNPELEETLWYFAPFAVFALPALMVGPCLTSKSRVFPLAIYTLTSRVVLVVAVVWAVWYWRNPVNGVAVMVVATAVIVVPGLWLCFGACSRGRLRRGVGLAEQLRYAVPLGIASALGALTLGMDKLVVSSMVTPEMYAVYVNGALEIPLIGVVTGAAAGVMMADITLFFRDGCERKVVDLFGRAAKKSSLILYPVMIMLFVLADDVMVTIYSDEYVESSVPFRIYLFLLPFRVVLYGAVLQGAGKSRIILLSSAMALVLNIVLSVILVKKLGYSGAAIGTVVTVGGFLVPFLLLQIARTTRVSVWKVLPYFDLVKRFMASALCGVIPFLLLRYVGEGWYSQVRLVVGGVVYGLSLVVVFQLLGFMDIRNWSQHLVRTKGGN